MAFVLVIINAIKKERVRETDNAKKISFMIFRTGSVLIVGNCGENIINIIYNFLKKMFKEEYAEIVIAGENRKVVKKKQRLRKKKIFIEKISN